MGTSKRKTRRITSLVFFVLDILGIVLCVQLLSSYTDIRLDIDNAKSRISNLQDILKRQNEDIDSLNVEISHFKNIEDEVNSIKNTYFDNAYIVDNMARSGEADYRVCYLTFDDGPYLLTDTILDVLEEKDVLATFFTRKRTDEDYIPIYKREKYSGHTIGNHTASHKIRNGVYESVDTFIEDIEENRDFIYDLVGIKTDVMRFPGGSSQPGHMGLDKQELVDRLNQIGYGYVDWSHATGDGVEKVSPNSYLSNVIDYTDDDDVIVILMHDYNRNTANILGELIDILSDQGYIFLPLWHDSPAVKKS